MLAAIYLAVVGLALIFVPLQFGVGAVPPDASPQLIALLRLLGDQDRIFANGFDGPAF